MLTAVHKQKWIEWVQKHINDDWSTTLFSDKMAFQLFQNIIEYWYKGVHQIHAIPKNRTKIFAWDGFCVGGKTSLFCFQQIMNTKFYVEILQKYIPEVSRMLGGRWRLQQDNDPKHTSHLAMEFLKENIPAVMDWPSNKSRFKSDRKSLGSC